MSDKRFQSMREKLVYAMENLSLCLTEECKVKEKNKNWLVNSLKCPFSSIGILRAGVGLGISDIFR